MATKKSSVFEKKLLKHLRDIGAEVMADEDDNVATHIEALARLTWKEALGYHVPREIVGKDGTKVVIQERVAPDRYAKQILFDHLLGKPKPQTQKQMDDKKPKAPPAHERINETLTGHLNEIAEKSHVDSGSSTGGDKASTRGSISKRLRILGMSKHGSDGS